MTEAAEQKPAFEGWVILELMGHRRLAGYLSEQTIGGTSFLRIDVPGDAGNVATQLYSGSAVYCITPTTETIARKVAKGSEPAPVTRWELREPPALKPPCEPYSDAQLHGAGESDDDFDDDSEDADDAEDDHSPI